MTGSQQLVLRRASAQPVAATTGRAQWLGAMTAGELTWNEAPAAAPPATERRDLLLRVYYVARAADGDAATPALRMKSLTAVAGQPAFVDTEVMPGVESLQALLLPDATAPRSVRLTLTLRPVPRRSTEEHRSVVEAILAGDAAGAHKLYAAHRRRGGVELMSIIERHGLQHL